tara:strand:+ start:107 stop:919 length:813 start_codon:yes stop_codon:yes gene_type:complete
MKKSIFNKKELTIFGNNKIKSFINSTDFDYHWDNNVLEVSKQKLSVAEEFLSPAIASLKGVNKQFKILDAGCGDGVHIDFFEKQKRKNFKLYALDISLSIISRLAEKDNKTQFIHADISNLPFKNNIFDITFSYGVIAYTHSPLDSFNELVRVTKKGGLIGVWLYPQKTGFLGFVFRIIRKITKHLNKFSRQRLADLIVPFLYFLPINSKINLSNSSWSQCREIVLVNIEPKNLVFFKEEEVLSWFKENDTEVVNISKEPISIWGKKKNK